MNQQQLEHLLDGLNMKVGSGRGTDRECVLWNWLMHQLVPLVRLPQLWLVCRLADELDQTTYDGPIRDTLITQIGEELHAQKHSVDAMNLIYRMARSEDAEFMGVITERRN